MPSPPDMLRKGLLRYGEHVDVTSYKNGVRSTLNGEGVADEATVWNQYSKEGCSVRLLRPQEHDKGLWALLAGLEEHWHR